MTKTIRAWLNTEDLVYEVWWEKFGHQEQRKLSVPRWVLVGIVFAFWLGALTGDVVIWSLTK